jgi:hypothetical protein
MELREGQNVTVWRIEATSNGDVKGPLQGTIIGREMPGSYAVDNCYYVRVTRTDLGGGGPVYEGEYLIEEDDLVAEEAYFWDNGRATARRRGEYSDAGIPGAGQFHRAASPLRRAGSPGGQSGRKGGYDDVSGRGPFPPATFGQRPRIRRAGPCEK